MSHLDTISVAILMGGQSSRMGQDKGLLEFQGKKMIAYALEEGQKLSDDVFIVGNHEGYHEFGVNVFKDIPVGKGPLKGIVTALYHARYSKVLILACDMPFYSAEIAKKMLSENTDDSTLIPKQGEDYQPLAGIYQKSAYQHFLLNLKQETYKITDALAGLPWKSIEMVPSQFHERSFQNMNTKQDLTKIV